MFKKLDTYTVAELKEEAKLRGIKGYSKLRKSELIELIQQSISPEVEYQKDESVNVTTKNKENKSRYTPTFFQDTLKKRNHPLDQWFAKFRNKKINHKTFEI